jgi:hypothetical protein
LCPHFGILSFAFCIYKRPPKRYDVYIEGDTPQENGGEWEMNITLKMNFEGKEITVGDIWFDNMGCEYEIKFSNAINTEAYMIQQRGFYGYDAGDFCLTFDIMDHETGDFGNFYFDTDMITKIKDGGIYYCEESDLMTYNPILAAINK